ncbi:MAG: hypothetical protein ACYTKD_29030 [Planctomycetota bacterium]
MKSIAVMPPERYLVAEPLWRALETVFPVRFEPRPFGAWEGSDGVVIFDPRGPRTGSGADPPPLQALVYLDRDRTGRKPRSRPVRFSRSGLLNSRLRGREMSDRSLPTGPDGDGRLPGECLAAVQGGVAWSALLRGGVRADFTVYPPPVPSAGEPLKGYLSEGNFLGLMPLVHFLRGVTAEEAWTPCYLFDDPNLHWRTYGYVDFHEIARSARAHGYHVSAAMVPIDTWMVWPETRRLFRSRKSLLSLALHGAEHTKRELGRLRDRGQARSLLQHALRRVSGFESRTGIPVDRVMAPPHGVCSEVAMREMSPLGIEAAAVSKPQPWLLGPPSGAPSLRWGPADFSAGGMPVLPRWAICYPADEIVLRAFLDQPLVLYAHHWDLAPRRGPSPRRSGFGRAGGTGVLDERAAEVASLGKVAWLPLGKIVRTNFMTRLEGARLRIRPFSRRMTVDVPEGVREVAIEADDPALEGHGAVAVGPAVPDGRRPSETASATIEVLGPGRMEVFITHPGKADPRAASPLGVRLWPYVRRVLTAARDRLQPVLGLPSAK